MNCYICKGEAKAQDQGSLAKVSCPRCSRYLIGDLAAHEISTWKPEQRVNLSGWLSENPDSAISASNIRSLAQLSTPPVGERATKLLLLLAKEHAKAGKRFKILSKKIGPLIAREEWECPPRYLSACWAFDVEEVAYIINSYLIEESGYLICYTEFAELSYAITPKGWSYLESIQRGNPASLTGFIAMWFNDEINDAWKTIDQAIRNAGYEPLRIDQKQHNNKIDDEIVAGIRRSKFLVADFTGHRGGVYFEAGLATGLGLPVIWLCRKDELEKTHFDTRQYNFIVWEADKLDELSKALKNRIEATIGAGPLQVAT